MNAEKIVEVLVAHTQHLIVPATDDPNGPWDVECNCDAEMTAQGFIAGERMHAEHVAAALEPAIQEREKAAWHSCAETAGDLKSVNSIPFVKELLRINPYDGEEEA